MPILVLTLANGEQRCGDSYDSQLDIYTDLERALEEQSFPSDFHPSDIIAVQRLDSYVPDSIRVVQKSQYVVEVESNGRMASSLREDANGGTGKFGAVVYAKDRRIPVEIKSRKHGMFEGLAAECAAEAVGISSLQPSEIASVAVVAESGLVVWEQGVIVTPRADKVTYEVREG